MKKYIIVLLLIPNIVAAQTCDIGTASGPIPESCITDVPPNPGKPIPAPPFGKPISVVSEPTTPSVLAEPVVAPDLRINQRKIRELKRKIAALHKKIRQYERAIKRLS